MFINCWNCLCPVWINTGGNRSKHNGNMQYSSNQTNTPLSRNGRYNPVPVGFKLRTIIYWSVLVRRQLLSQPLVLLTLKVSAYLPAIIRLVCQIIESGLYILTIKLMGPQPKDISDGADLFREIKVVLDTLIGFSDHVVALIILVFTCTLLSSIIVHKQLQYTCWIVLAEIRKVLYFVCNENF